MYDWCFGLKLWKVKVSSFESRNWPKSSQFSHSHLSDDESTPFIDKPWKVEDK